MLFSSTVLNPDVCFVFFLGAFDGRPADYLFMLLFNWICIVVSFSAILGQKHAPPPPPPPVLRFLEIEFYKIFKSVFIPFKNRS